MLRQSHFWSLTVSLGILTAVSIASGTLSLGEKNAFNAKKVPIETLDDTDVDTDTDTDESSCALEEEEVQQSEQTFRKVEENVHDVKEQRDSQQAPEMENTKVQDETISIINTVCEKREEPNKAKQEMIEIVTVKNEATWEWPDLLQGSDGFVVRNDLKFELRLMLTVY